MLSDSTAGVKNLSTVERPRVSLKEILLPHPNTHLIFDLKPNMNVTFQRSHVQTNECGFRGPNRKKVREPNTFRIALLGDSFAFGWGVEYEESFGYVLEESLNEKTKGNLRVEVLNFGVPGYSTFQELELFKETAQDYDPDLVLVYIVENDVGHPAFLADPDGSGNIRHLTKEIARRTTERFPNPNHAIGELSEMGRKEGFKVYAVINPNRHEEKVRGQFWALRQKHYGIKQLRIGDRFRELIEERKIPIKSLSLGWDPHPSRVKHALLGEILAEQLWMKNSELKNR